MYFLEALTRSYAAHPGPRPRQQWRRVYREVSRLLGAPSDREVGSPEELERLLENLESLDVLFTELEELDEVAGGDPDAAQLRLRSVLVSQVTITLQAMLADVRRWHDGVYSGCGASPRDWPGRPCSSSSSWPGCSERWP